jgi:hypothetical protein
MFSGFEDLLNLKNEVTVTKTIETNDGMGGFATTTSSVLLPKAAIWQNNGTSRFISGKYALTSTHILCFPYGDYTFNVKPTSGTIIENVTYDGNNYTVDGFADNVMNMNEIITQGLQRIS